MAIVIPMNGFQIDETTKYKELEENLKETYRSHPSFINKLTEAKKDLHKEYNKPSLRFHKVIPGDKIRPPYNEIYIYAVTVKGKLRICFFFDDGKINPDTVPPKKITLFYIGDYH